MNNEHTHDSEGPQDEAGRMYDLLCRYVFGEATDAEGAEVEKALAGSEELRAQKAELDATVALVQGAFVGGESDAKGSLSTAQMDELQDAARESAVANADFELKPVLRGPRPWYAQPAVRFTAAATVLLGVGAYFVTRPVEWSTFGEPASSHLDEQESELAARSTVLGFTPDASTVPSPIEAAESSLRAAKEAFPEMSDGPIRVELAAETAVALDRISEARPKSGAGGGASVSRKGTYRGPGDSTPPRSRAQTATAAPVTGPASPGPRRPNAAAPQGLIQADAEEGSSFELNLAVRSSERPQFEVFTTAGSKDSGVQSSSDDFFLGRGESDTRVALKEDRAKQERSRTLDVPPAQSLSLDMTRFERRKGERPRDMFFRFWGDNPFIVTRNDGLSTFAADVDSASFTLGRRMLREGMLPKRDQIRTEEFVNYATPDLAPPTEATFAIHAELAPSPFGGREDRWLMRVGVKAKEIALEERPPLALTFVVDTSGSMRTDNRLELVKHALRLLVGQLDGRDTLSIVGFNSTAQEVLPPTPATESDTIETALLGLQPGGGTNADAGLKLGYALNLSGSAAPNVQKRVIFLSDGVANMGQTDQDRLALEVSEYADQGVFLNTIGVGMSNHSDVFLEQLANKGQGVCDYVGDAADARRAIVDRFVSGFVTVAKDLKIQVEFDGQAVLRWRQLGYENRAVADRDFRNDAVDAGEVGAGHQVTCFYELELASGVSDADAALAKVRLRWKPVTENGDLVQLGTKDGLVQETENAFTYAAMVAPSFRAASAGFRLGALSAQFAELLRQSYHSRGDSLEGLSKGFANLLSDAPSKDVGAMAEALKLAKGLGLKAPPAPRATDSDAAQQAAYYESLIESLGGADPLESGQQPEESTRKGVSTPEAYERRIRRLLDGDQEKRQH